ncbi:hypothetical protein FB45DRAFT_1066311 [Roridomyces roridus]|uniref:F-box domain-containing protein n=1 Tax=Roridomyces roridus TaxID=1738132 RepID=A0AAD7B596_9AGAR|nr:hypothetical protein FB45DRAFT_1066311 [Roridomyces roridus]
MSFADFPLDVVLELTKELDLPDALHLAATCSFCAEVLRMPYFWINALTRMDRVNRIPSPCVPETDLTALSLETLREIAIHASKLHRRWSSASPRPVAVHTFDLVGDRVLYLFPIEGKRMVITVSFPRIACWDTDSGQCLGFWNRRDRANDAWSASSPFTTAGMCYIGFVSHLDTRIKFTIVARGGSLSDELRPLSMVIVNAHTIGVVMSRDDPVPDSSRCLLFSRISDGLLRQFTLPIEPSIHSLVGLAVDDDFLIIGQSFTSMGPITSLRSTPSRRLRVQQLDFPPPEPTIEQQGSSLGYHNIELLAGSILSYESPGFVDSFAVGSTGIWVITVDLDNAQELGLLHYVSEPTPHVDFRSLPVSPEIQELLKDEDWEYALDDRLGVLYLMLPGDEKARMTVIYYV